MLYRSPHTTRDLQTVINLARPGDGIVLMQDAVLAIRIGSELSKDSWIRSASTRGVKLYAINADLEARSVEGTPAVESITIDNLVELLWKYDRTYS